MKKNDNIGILYLFILLIIFSLLFLNFYTITPFKISAIADNYIILKNKQNEIIRVYVNEKFRGMKIDKILFNSVVIEKKDYVINDTLNIRRHLKIRELF
jgi:hypothetical protein